MFAEVKHSYNDHDYNVDISHVCLKKPCLETTTHFKQILRNLQYYSVPNLTSSILTLEFTETLRGCHGDRFFSTTKLFVRDVHPLFTWWHTCRHTDSKHWNTQASNIKQNSTQGLHFWLFIYVFWIHVVIFHHHQKKKNKKRYFIMLVVCSTYC